MGQKIAILLPDLRGGGAERMRIYLSQHFLDLGYRVDFVLMQARGELLKDVSSKANIIDLKAARIRAVLGPLVRYLRQAQPDVLLAAMWPLTVIAVLAHRLAGRPGRVIVSDHSILSKSPIAHGWRRRFCLRTTMAFSYPCADARIAVSRGVADDLARLGQFAQSSINVVYNPAALDECLLKQNKPDPWVERPGKRILSVGTLKAVKDHAMLIRAFAQVLQYRTATLVILGDGSLRPNLERLIAELRLIEYVYMPGFVHDPYPWYLGTDLFVLSSRHEGFGNVIVEALQCGVPVVSTDCPSGPREILDDGRYGRLVPVGDEEALAEAMEAALSEKPDREALKARAQEFSVDRIAQQYLDVLFSSGHSPPCQDSCHLTGIIECEEGKGERR